MLDLVVRGGRIVTADEMLDADLGVADGRIVSIGRDPGEARSVVDADGMFVFPGAIDAHAHLNDPGYTWREDFAHGTSAAAAGGVTTVIDMPLQNEPALCDAEIWDRKLAAVAPQAFVDYAFLGGAIGHNLDKLGGLHDKGAVGFKVFIGPVSPDYRSLDMGEVRDTLAAVGRFGGVVCFHAEDYAIVKYEEAKAAREGRGTWRDFLDSRPAVAECIATRNIIELVRECRVRAHICHVSHPDAADAIRRAQRAGLPVTGETCMHYLVFTEEDVLRNGSLFKCAPPLRKREDRERLWAYVEDGTLACVASDHSPCTPQEKDERVHGVFGAWGGISGIQSTMQVFFDQVVHRRGGCPTLLARRLSRDVARIFGLSAQKGAIQIGRDADLAVLDPQREWEIAPTSLFYLNRISAFVGRRGRGLPVKTFVRGRLVFDEGRIVGEAGFGRLARRG